MTGVGPHRFGRNDLLPGPIRGIHRTSLWASWKAIRRELRRASIRDVIDFLDYDVDPDVWINRLLARIASGEYEPETPRRFTLGKSKGFSRTMTMPAVPDLVLYRTIVDYVYERSRGKKHRNVYFLRDHLSKAQKAAFDEALGKMREARDFEVVDGTYRFTGRRSFYNWLRFDQYRKRLIQENAKEFLVVTDIANFFDTVLHSHVADAVQGLAVPPRMIGLLFFLLEHLSIRQDYSSSHGISLPTDEFDCSRTLAHLVLFSHDDAMVQLVGEGSYVRWMDDQNMAVSSKAEGLRVLNAAGRSLARLHLTPNSQKSKVLTLIEARRHYHLDLNKLLDEAEALGGKAPSSTAALNRFRSKVKGVWRKARKHEGVGEFGKILKRLYLLAGLAGVDLFRSRAQQDILTDPAMSSRVANYYRCTGTVDQYLDFVEELFSNPEQIHADVNVSLTESLLRIEPEKTDLARLRRLSKALVRQQKAFPGSEDCAAIATLLLLRFGNAALRLTLKQCIENKKQRRPRQVVRAAAVIFSSHDEAAFEEVRAVASATLRNHLSTVVLLVDEIQNYEEIPVRYKNRLQLGTDSVAGRKFVDMRVILSARLLRLNEKPQARQWVRDWLAKVLGDDISAYDRRLLRRLVKIGK